MLTPHPGLPEFDYLRPATLAEACQFLAEHPAEARAYLGGTDLLVRLRDGALRPRYLVDLKGLPDLHTLTYSPTAGLTIGAAVVLNRVIAAPAVLAHYPVLAEAAHTVASYPLRNRATLVGNLCNASPAGDTLGAGLVLEGALQIHGPAGARTEPLNAFFKGPGRTTLQPGEVVTAVQLPPPPPGYAARYIKLGRNQSGDLAIVGVTVLGHRAETPAGFQFRVALGAVAPTPLRATAAETLLAAQPLTTAVLLAAAEAAATASTPIDDVRGSATYRRAMVAALVHRALADVWHHLR